MTREQMARHEAWISRPVKELFPKNDGVYVKCAVCGTTFFRKAIVGGKARRMCSAKCRDKRRNHASDPVRAA